MADHAEDGSSPGMFWGATASRQALSRSGQYRDDLVRSAPDGLGVFVEWLDLGSY